MSSRNQNNKANKSTPADNLMDGSVYKEMKVVNITYISHDKTAV